MDKAGALDHQDPRQVRSVRLSSESVLSKKERSRLFQRESWLYYYKTINHFKAKLNRLNAALEDEDSRQKRINNRESSRTAASTSHAQYDDKVVNNPSSLSSLSSQRYRSLQLRKGNTILSYYRALNRLKALVEENSDQRRINDKENSRTAASTSHAQHDKEVPNNPSRSLLLSRPGLELPKGCSIPQKLQMRIAVLKASSQRKLEILSCKICRYKTVNADKMKLHMESYHFSGKQCVLCSETFTTFGGFRRHLMDHGSRVSAKSASDFLLKRGAVTKRMEEISNNMESLTLASSSSPLSNLRKTPDAQDWKVNSTSGTSVQGCIGEDEVHNYCKLCNKVFSSETEFMDHLSIIHNISIKVTKRYEEEKMLPDEIIIDNDAPVVNNLSIPHNNTSLNLQSVCSSLSKLQILPRASELCLDSTIKKSSYI